MKNITILLLLIIGIVSCDGGGDEPDSTTTSNNPPSIPSLVSPTNGLLCLENGVNFTWNSSVDPEGDNITYEIFIAKDSQFINMVKKETTASLTKSYTLEKGVPYYWKVKAIDSKNKSSDYSNQWGFYTEGIGIINYAPFAAILTKIEISSNSVTIQWNAFDLNTNDILTYDIYFATSSAFTAPIITDHPSKLFTKNDLILNSTYFMRVDVKDNKGAKTIGQVWSFKF